MWKTAFPLGVSCQFFYLIAHILQFAKVCCSHIDFLSLRGMVVIKGRRPDVDALDGDDSDLDYEDDVAESIAAMSEETIMTDETRVRSSSAVGDLTRSIKNL